MQADIASDRKLRLEVPCDLPPGPVEVVVVVQQASKDEAATEQGAGPQPLKARSGLFIGKARGDIDIDAALDEMNTLGKAKLLDLRP